MAAWIGHPLDSIVRQTRRSVCHMTLAERGSATASFRGQGGTPQRVPPSLLFPFQYYRFTLPNR